MSRIALRARAVRSIALQYLLSCCRVDVLTARQALQSVTIAAVGQSLSVQTTVDSYSVRYEVSGESIPDWAIGVDPEPDERGPPASWEGFDPASPDE